MKHKSFLWLLLAPAAALFILITSFTNRGNKNHAVPAVVYTKAVNNITTTTATCSYRIQITANLSQAKQIGVVVAKGPGATVKTTNLNFYTTYGIKALGDYVTNLKGLDPGVTFYARAYVKIDTTYVYGNAVAFKTLTPQKPPAK